MLEEELLTLQIFLEGDLVNVYPLIRTLSISSKTEGCHSQRSLKKKLE